MSTQIETLMLEKEQRKASKRFGMNEALFENNSSNKNLENTTQIEY